MMLGPNLPDFVFHVGWEVNFTPCVYIQKGMDFDGEHKHACKTRRKHVLPTTTTTTTTTTFHRLWDPPLVSYKFFLQNVRPPPPLYVKAK